MSTKLRTNAKNDFEKDFFKLMNKSVFCKTIEDVRNHRDIKLVITNERRDKLASEPNYHTTTQLSEKLIEIEMKKTVILMNKPIYLGQAILDISKTLMYEFMNFGMTILSKNMVIKQNYVIWILIALSFSLKQKIFTKILRAMWISGSTPQHIMKMIKDHYQ